MLDDLVQYCLTEIAYEGELGCTVSRLKELVTEFCTNLQANQNVDVKFVAYVWDIMAAHPSIHIGTVPKETPAVWVAPPAQKKDVVAPPVELTPLAGESSRSVLELEKEYGDQLRVAANKSTTFYAITGSHERPAKLSPTVYTILQLVCRARSLGIATKDLGPLTGYDPRSIHYQIIQLLDLGLLIKYIKGTSQNWVVHKRWADSVRIWSGETPNHGEEEILNIIPGPSVQLNNHPSIPIAGSEVTNVPLLRARLVRLLLDSPNHTRPFSNLILACGYADPVKNDRRFFTSRVHDLISDGTLQKFKLNDKGGDRIALSEKFLAELDQSSDRIPAARAPAPVFNSILEDADNGDVYERSAYPLAFNIPMQRQIIDVIHAHPEGLTIKEISELMDHLDRRTIEHVMTRAAGRIPPKPMSYLQVCLVMETAGKQRRQRFYTWEHYRALLRSQKLNDDRFGYLNDDHRDEFMELKREQFYTTEQELVAHEKAISDSKKPSLQRVLVKKKKRPGKNPIVNGVPKRGRPRKEHPPGEPKQSKRKTKVVEDGDPGENKAKKPRKRKAEEMEGGGLPAKPRPSKRKKAPQDTLLVADAASTSLAPVPNPDPIPVANGAMSSQLPITIPAAIPVAVPITAPGVATLATVPAVPPALAPAGPSRKRGRPPKSQPVNEAPAPKKPRKSKQEVTEPVPKSVIEQIDTVATAVPPAPEEQQTSSGVPQAMIGGEQSIAERLVVQIAPPISAQGPSTDASVVRGRGKRAQISKGRVINPRKPRSRKDPFQVNNLLARAPPASAPCPAPMFPSFQAHDELPIDLQAPHSEAPTNSELTFLSKAVQGVNDPSMPEPSAGVHAEKTSTGYTPDRIASRRSVAAPKNITNISDIRRMNELLSLMRARGGIITVNYELSFLWAGHIKALQGEGVVTSASADARVDKKTVMKIVGMLEDSGQIKVVKTLSPDLQRRISLKQPVTIAHLPEVSLEDVHQYILSMQNAFKTLTAAPPADAVNDVDILPNPRSVKSVRNRRSRSPRDRQKRVPLPDPESYGARRPFLEDQLTLRQMAGYLLGRARRAQELHLFTLNHILSPNPSDHVVSVEEGLISIKYWFTDFPLGSFCAVVPLRRYLPYIERAQTEPDLLSQPLITLDAEVYNGLEVRSHKTKERLLEILEILVNIKFVTPLVETESENAEIKVEPCASHPTRFNSFIPPILKVGKLPKYWRFNRIAPQYLYAFAGDEEPPLYRDAPLNTIDEAVNFWNFLKLQSDGGAVQSSFNLEAQETRSVTGDYSCSRGVVATLTSPRGWRSKYALSQVQVAYLRSLVDWKTSRTPLNDDTPSRLLEACYLTCAPEAVVCEYLAYLHDRALAHIATQQRRRRENGARKKISQEAEMRTALANKTAQHLQTLERQWLDLLKETYPEPLTDGEMIKLLPLRGRFVTNIGPFDKEKLIRLIKISLASDRRGASDDQMAQGSYELHAPNLDDVFPRTNAPDNDATPLGSGRSVLPPAIEHQGDQDVAALVASMGQMTSSVTPKPNMRSQKRKEAPTAEVALRRKRFNWKPEYDELLLDAVAVIRARSRYRKRTMEWAPVTKVFPTIHQNSCRLRYNHLQGSAGSAVYMERLTDAWYHLWQAHLGTDYLPDEDPNALGGCDLVTHIEFLRKYIDKNSIRTGVALAKLPSKTRVPLPASFKDLDGIFSIADGSPTENQERDRCWREEGIELRAKAFHMQAFVDSAPIKSIQEPNSKLCVASSATHAIMATDAKSYDEDKAASALSAFGNETVRHAARSLQERGIITKTGWKPHPGRTYKLTDHFHEAMQGDIAPTTYIDAHEFAVDLEGDSGWMEWPMVIKDGDMAVFLQRFSDHKLDFKIGRRERFGKELLDDYGYISKNIDDDVLETPLQVRSLTDDAEDPISSPSASSSNDDHLREAIDAADVDIEDEDEGPSHGFSDNGEKATCVLSKLPVGLIDCVRCIQDSLRKVLSELQQEGRVLDAELLDSLYAKVNLAGPGGLIAEVVKDLLMERRAVAQRLLTGPIPVLFWTGYSRSRLVAATYLPHYTVKAFPVSLKGKEKDSGDSSVIIFPRCWLDLCGKVVDGIWIGLLRSILAIVLVQGRVPQVEIVRKLSDIYDRLEVLDGLKYLQGVHQLRRLYHHSEEEDLWLPSWGVGEETVEEAQSTVWEVEECVDWSEYV